jgi:hypothetical protein
MGILGQRTNCYEYHAEAAQDPSFASPHFLAQNLAPDLICRQLPKEIYEFRNPKKENMKYAP